MIAGHRFVIHIRMENYEKYMAKSNGKLIV